MGNVKEIVANVAQIRRMHKKRESLFKAAILQTSHGIRRICTVGCMNALLFEKDLEMVYNVYKYSLEDGQLGSILRSEHDILLNYRHLPVAVVIKEHQHDIICRYHRLKSQGANLIRFRPVTYSVTKLHKLCYLHGRVSLIAETALSCTSR